MSSCWFDILDSVDYLLRLTQKGNSTVLQLGKLSVIRAPSKAGSLYHINVAINQSPNMSSGRPSEVNDFHRDEIVQYAIPELLKQSRKG